MFKKIVTVTSLALGACNSTPTRELTTDEEAIIDRLMEVGPYEDATAELLMQQFTVPVFDADGNTGIAAAQASMDETRLILEQYYEAGHIYVYEESDTTNVTEDTAAFHHENRFGPDYIAVSAEELWEYGILKHEAGHKLRAWLRHDDEVPAAWVGGDSATAIPTIIEHQDFPYLLTIAYMIPDRIFWLMEDRISAAFEYSQNELERGTIHSSEVMSEYDRITAEMFSSFDTFVHEIWRGLGQEVPWATAAGVSEESVIHCIREGGLMQYGIERQAETRTELQRWLEAREPTETRTEVRVNRLDRGQLQ